MIMILLIFLKYLRANFYVPKSSLETTFDIWERAAMEENGDKDPSMFAENIQKLIKLIYIQKSK